MPKLIAHKKLKDNAYHEIIGFFKTNFHVKCLLYKQITGAINKPVDQSSVNEHCSTSCNDKKLAVF